MSGLPTLSAILLLFKRLIEDARSDAFYAQTTNYIAFMGYTILLWDHIISFEDEVRYIWMRPKSPAAYLFFLNRYFTPIAFIGNLVAYFAEWSEKTCHRFVRYEGSCTIIALEVAALIMLLRVWALYRDSKLILGSVILLLLLETGVFAWLMTDSIAVDHKYSVKACTMIFDPKKLGTFWPSASAWLPLLYDTYVAVLTLYKCIPRVRKSSAGYIFRVLLRDGLLYYSVLFMINLILTVMIVAAPDPIKNITAQLEQMLTVAMISRITLSLRRSAAQQRAGLVTPDDNAYQFELDAWRTAKREPRHVRTVRSSTMCQHISVVPRSDLMSDSPFPSQVVSMHEDTDKARWSHVENATDSIGVLSISPAHTHEAAMASGIGAVVPPEDRVAVIADPSMLNDQNAYELRVMRPAHTITSTNHLRLPRL